MDLRGPSNGPRTHLWRHRYQNKSRSVTRWALHTFWSIHIWAQYAGVLCPLSATSAFGMVEKAVQSFEFSLNAQSWQFGHYCVVLNCEIICIYIVINHFKFNSWHHDKCKVALKLIPLLTTSNLFWLEVVQIGQLCVIRENSILC